jgi:hypothetical protein
LAKILCATRGGEASYRTQDAAIALALERNDGLAFLYVVDLAFLNTTAHAVRPDVVDAEMTRLGEFLLEMARERARRHGLEAEAIVRHGTLAEELVAAVRHTGAVTVVLGKPDEGAVYDLEDLKDFAKAIEAETGAETVILPAD